MQGSSVANEGLHDLSWLELRVRLKKPAFRKGAAHGTQKLCDIGDFSAEILTLTID